MVKFLERFIYHLDGSASEIITDHQVLWNFLRKPKLSKKETRYLKAPGNFGISHSLWSVEKSGVWRRLVKIFYWRPCLKRGGDCLCHIPLYLRTTSILDCWLKPWIRAGRKMQRKWFSWEGGLHWSGWKTNDYFTMKSYVLLVSVCLKF